MKVTTFVFLSTLIASPATTAGSLYKCIDAKGNSAYQEVPCPKATKQAGRGYVQPVAASPQLGWARQAPALARQQSGQLALIEAQAGPRVGSSGNSYAADQERKQAISQLESEKFALGSLNSRGKRELYAQMLDQQAALRGVDVPSRPAQAPDPSPARQAPRTTQVQDQNGNFYTKPPGSAFATDNKTGKQCFTYGNWIDCK